jgi:hypothetical protein
VWTNLTIENALENANTRAQVVEHIGIGTWKQGVEVSVEKGKKCCSKLRVCSGPDHGAWVQNHTLSAAALCASSRPCCAGGPDHGPSIPLGAGVHVEWRAMLSELRTWSGGGSRPWCSPKNYF